MSTMGKLKDKLQTMANRTKGTTEPSDGTAGDEGFGEKAELAADQMADQVRASVETAGEKLKEAADSVREHLAERSERRDDPE